MRHVVFLAENFLNVTQFPGHVITMNPTNPEAFRVGSSRRSLTSRVQNDSPTSVLDIRIELDRVREADTLIIDRNSDIAGRNVLLQVSDVNFQSNTEYDAVNTTAGPDVVQGSNYDDPTHAIRTEEGAYIFRFDPVASKRWKLAINASVINAPKLGGVYLGKSYRPQHPRMPFDEATRWETFGTVRRGVPDNDRRTGKMADVSLMMRDEQEWDTARWTLRQLFGRGHPMWFIHTPNTERAWLAHNVGGVVSAPFSERPQGRTVVVGLEEYDGLLP